MKTVLKQKAQKLFMKGTISVTSPASPERINDVITGIQDEIDSIEHNFPKQVRDFRNLALHYEIFFVMTERVNYCFTCIFYGDNYIKANDKEGEAYTFQNFSKN